MLYITIYKASSMISNNGKSENDIVTFQLLNRLDGDAKLMAFVHLMLWLK